MDQEIKIVGNSPAIKKLIFIIKRAAKTDLNLLLLGETGVGKELAARMVHRLSKRKDNPFIKVNCANLNENLLESELFGYKKGAFTGAITDKPGLIEWANGGTFFMDEIADNTPYLQAKLLGIVEERELRRLGENKNRKINVRFIFATNKNLYELVKRGEFRQDLYYRISILTFWIPPLRERKEDVPLLVEKILKKQNVINKKNKIITQQALNKLLKYHYPGNIRELENILQRAHILSDRKEISHKEIEFEGDVKENFLKNLDFIERTYKSLKQGADYWETVHEPFKRNEFSKDQVWEIIHLALKETLNKKFKEALPYLNIDLKEHKRFLNSLRRYRYKRRE